MQRATGIPSGTKEKLVFLAVSSLLALTVYNLLVSTPVKLEVGPAVSAVPPPGPLDPEKLDTRVANVEFYKGAGALVGIPDPKTGQFADRGRSNPFQPLEDLSPGIGAPGTIVNGAGPKTIKGPKVSDVPPPPDEPVAEAKPVEEKKKKVYEPKVLVADVDFSAVMTMNNQTYGLLKSKDGSKTMQVKVGDYLDDYKYTVTSIDKQAIYVTDDDQHLFVARDTTFDAGSAAGGAAGDDEPAAPKKKKPDAAPAAEKAPAPAAGKQPGPGGGGNGQRRPRGGGGGGTRKGMNG